MSMGFSISVRNGRAQVIIDNIGAGGDILTTSGVMRFYTGARPSTGVAITDQILLASCELSEPSGTVSNGVLTFETINDELSVNATGVIIWCRIVDSDGAFVIDLGCGLSGSGQEIIFNKVSVQLGGAVKILSGSFTEGNV